MDNIKNKKKVIIVSIFSVLLTLIVGTLAWFTWRSNKTAMVLTIGDINKMSVTISPYQIKGELLPTLSYDSEGNTHTQVTVTNNKSITSKFNLYYHINDGTSPELLSSLKYTILMSYDGVNYTKRSEKTLTDATVGSDIIILENQNVGSGRTFYFQVYLWLDGSDTNQSSMQNKYFDGELRAVLPKKNTTPITAIYSEDDNSLRFYNTNNIPATISTGDIYNELVVTEKWSLEEQYSNSNKPAWSDTYGDVITNIVVEDNIIPYTTSYWFSNLKKVIDIDLTKLDLSEVESMQYMFSYTGSDIENFNLDLSTLDVSNVTNVNYLFCNMGYNSKKINLDLSKWDVSNITNMVCMFYQLGYNSESVTINLNNWDTSNVKNMSDMFCSVGQNAVSLNIIGIGKWDVSNVTDMQYLFNSVGQNVENFTLDVSNWNTESVTNIDNMFQSAGKNSKTFTLDLSNLNVSKVKSFTNVFWDSGKYATTWSIGDLSNWDVSSITSIYCMFNGAGYNATNFNLGDLGKWDVSNITSMYGMFEYTGYNATTWSIGDISNWNTGKITDMGSMFYQAGRNATTFSLGDLSNWNTSNVTNMYWTFAYAGYAATGWSLDLSGWNVSKVTNHSGFNNGVTSKVTAPTWVS